MASVHNIRQTITQAVIEVAIVAIMAVTEAETPSQCRRTAHLASRASRLALWQQTFDWKLQDKCKKLNTFEN